MCVWCLCVCFYYFIFECGKYYYTAQIDDRSLHCLQNNCASFECVVCGSCNWDQYTTSGIDDGTQIISFYHGWFWKISEVKIEFNDSSIFKHTDLLEKTRYCRLTKSSADWCGTLLGRCSFTYDMTHEWCSLSAEVEVCVSESRKIQSIESITWMPSFDVFPSYPKSTCRNISIQYTIIDHRWEYAAIKNVKR